MIDYSKLPTEQNNQRSSKIDRVSTLEILKIINDEDKSVPNSVWNARQQIANAVEMIVAQLNRGGRLFFTGAGTSGRFAVMEAAECPPTFGTSPDLVQAVMAGGKNSVFRSKEGAEDNERKAFQIFSARLKSNDVVVGIAASGVTPFVQGAFKAAKRKKNKIALITCNGQFSSSIKIDCVISAPVGPEVITGSTRLKAGTATKLILNMLTVASMIKLGKVYKNWMVDVQPKSNKLKARAIRLIERLGEVSPADAYQLFIQSKKNVKVAIVMAKKDMNCAQAVKKLKQHHGFLHPILEA